MPTLTVTVIPAVTSRGQRLRGQFDAYCGGRFVCRFPAPLLASARWEAFSRAPVRAPTPGAKRAHDEVPA